MTDYLVTGIFSTLALVIERHKTRITANKATGQKAQFKCLNREYRCNHQMIFTVCFLKKVELSVSTSSI